MPIGQMNGLGGSGMNAPMYPQQNYQNQMQPKKRGGAYKFFFGTPEEQGVQSRYSPQNQGNFDQVIMQILQQYLSGLQGDPNGLGNFEPIAAQAREGFNTRTLPSIMERLTQLGGGGGRSNAYYNLPAQAGVDLELGLNAQRAQFGQGQQQLLQNLLGLGQQEPYYRPRQPGFAENIFLGANEAGKDLAKMGAKMAMGGF